MNALRKIADELARMADEEDAGHIVPSDDIRLAARRLQAQADMRDEGL